MKEISQNNLLASAVKRATLCAATTALLTTTPIANAVDIKVGGYVKTDAIYDLDADLGPSLAVSKVPTGSDTSSDPSFRIHSLQSRLNFSASHDSMKVFIEADFFTGDSSELVSNSRHERLRHAYFKIGDLVIGQTWSTFMDANWVLYPNTVDFAGPAGATFVRQSQFRWTIDDGFDFALENPENRVSGAPGVRDTLPDVILRYASAGDVSWQIAGLFQQFEVDGGAADGESESNFGVTGGVNFKVGSGDSISVKANVNSNRYTYYGWLNPAAVVDGGDIELVDHTAMVAAYNHDWGGATTTIAYGMVEFDDDYLLATEVDNLNTFHINYRWSPYQDVNFGVEVSRAEQELVSGDDGDATRLQFGAQYNF
ncbi:MAG: hypothetical protein GY896_01040 [Gammaproteobacteria bacterium]|nr:hypothetical protein [Gammaproteobacteria bacterium]